MYVDDGRVKTISMTQLDLNHGATERVWMEQLIRAPEEVVTHTLDGDADC